MQTAPKPFVFVLMPFATDFDDAYALAVKPACEAAGAYAERVDEQIFHESIVQRIYNQIAKADLLIAEMTGRNPNVFYEVGYAHALGKTVILLTRDSADIPFDLKHYPHIVYGGKLTELRTELERRVRYLVEHQSATPTAELHSTFEVTVNSVELGTGAPVVETRVTKTYVSFEVTVHNSAARLVRTATCQIGAVTPSEFRYLVAGDDIEMPSMDRGEHVIHRLPETFQMLPGAWESAVLSGHSEGEYQKGATIGEFAVRIFMASGFVDYPFILRVKG
jgi:hypothetical protein